MLYPSQWVHHTKGLIILIYLIINDVNFHHLVKVVSAWFLHCKVTIFLFIINKYLGKILDTMQFLLKLLPTNFSIHGPVGSCLQQLPLLWYWPNVDIFISFFSLHILTRIVLSGRAVSSLPFVYILKYFFIFMEWWFFFPVC